MSLQVGRIGLATASGGDGYTLDDPSEISQNGRSLRLNGIQSGTTNALLWLRDQFLGLANPGAEPVIPVLFSTVSQLDGYYRVLGAQADHPRGGLGASGSTNWMFWSVDLERIRDWRDPKIEIQTLAGIITNSHSVTTGSLWMGMPGGVRSYYHGLPAIGATSFTNTNGDDAGSQTIYQNGPESQAAIQPYVPWTQHLYVPASSWYKYGCRVEYNVAAGGTYYEVVGHRPFPESDVASRMRMSNGLVRVLWDATGSISTYWYDGSAWDGPYRWDLDHGAAVLNFTSWTVLRNTPEECSVRGLSNVTGDTLGPVYCDLTIRRGSRNVIGYAVGAGYQATFQFGLVPNATYSATSITGGARRTSNDGNGNRPFLVSNNGTTITTGTGKIAQASAGSPFLFNIGCEVAGSSATGLNVVAEQAAQFWLGMSETQVVTAL